MQLPLFDPSKAEERVLVCSKLVFAFSKYPHFTEAVGREPCGNLLRIIVYPESAGQPESIAAVNEYDVKGIKQGACITLARKMVRSKPGIYRSERVYTYGPIRSAFFLYVHCKRCRKRWSWIRFKKVNI